MKERENADTFRPPHVKIKLRSFLRTIICRLVAILETMFSKGKRQATTFSSLNLFDRAASDFSETSITELQTKENKVRSRELINGDCRDFREINKQFSEIQE